MNSHSTIIFVCLFCSKELVNFEYLKHHIRISHDLSSITDFNCAVRDCSRSFSNLRSLYKHIRRDHLSTETHSNGLKSVLESNEISLRSTTLSNTQSPHTFNQESISSSGKKLTSSVNHELSWVLKLYNRITLTRSDIDKIVTDTSDYMMLKNESDSNSFENISSEYKRINMLKDLKIWIEPEKVLLTHVDKVVNGVLVNKPVHGIYISLRNIFEILLNTPSLRNIIDDYMLKNNNSKDILTDVKDGSIFHNVSENTLPFVVFYDEMETGNPLGSHKGIHKLGAFYVSLRCFPTHFYSLLSNIFLYTIFSSSHRTYINVLLNRLVKEINDLSTNGVSVDGKTYYFKFIGFTGDNLGLHQLLGFVESFVANYPCRICKASKPMCQEMIEEDKSLLRNPINYAVDVQLDDVSLTGIKSSSVLNNITSFHVTKNCFLDLMHDVLEGVASFGLANIIFFYINNEVFKLYELNERIQNFKFYNCKPPVLKISYIEKGDLGLSASENLNLSLYLGMIIGDRVPHGCEIWEYYKTLRNLINLLMMKEIHVKSVEYIKTLISEHNQLYVTVFKKKLKPKHHHLLHYPQMILSTGPASHNWGMRFEGKNLELKVFAKLCRSRVNVCRSIAIRSALMFASYIYTLRNVSKIDYVELGPLCKNVRYDNRYKWYCYKGIKYQLGSMVAFGFMSIMPKFGKVSCLMYKEKEPVIGITIHETIYYDEHLQAYRVSSDSFMSIILDISEVSPPLLSIDERSTILIANLGI